MEPYREALVQALEQAGRTAPEASQHLGRNEQYIWQYLHYGTPKELGEEDRRKLAAWLDIDEARLRPPRLNASLRRGSATSQLGGTRGRPIDGFLPIYRYGTGREPMIVDRIERPGFLDSVPEAFATYMPDDSAAPRYNAGEVLFIHPHRPVTAGRPDSWVLLEMLDGSIAVRRLVSQTDSAFTVEQINPAKRSTIPANTVSRVLHIAGTHTP